MNNLALLAAAGWNRRGAPEVELLLTERELEMTGARQDEGTALELSLVDAEALLAVDRTMRSRMFPVDAGVDAGELQHRFGKCRRHAVVAGLIRPKVVQSDNGVPTLSGDVLELVVSRVHVPLKLRRHFEAFLPRETWKEIEARERIATDSGWPSPTPSRYRATLAVGRRHEPWLVNAEPMTIPDKEVTR